MYDIKTVWLSGSFTLNGNNIVGYVYEAEEAKYANTENMQRITIGQEYNFDNAIIVVYPEDLTKNAKMEINYLGGME